MYKTTKAVVRRTAGLLAIPALLACGSVLATDTAAPASQPGLLVFPNVKIQAASPEQVRASDKASAASAGIRAFKDKDTGRLRPATPEELEAIAAETPAAAQQPDTQGTFVQLSSGAIMMDLGESAMSYSVVRKGADGRVDMQCVTGAEAASKAMSAKLAPKEHNHAH